MNTRIGDVPSFLTNLLTTTTDEIEKTSTSQGVGSTTGEVAPVTPGYQMIVSALASFAPKVGADFEMRLAEITSKLKEISGDVNKERVLNEQESKRINMQENQAKLQESEAKLEDAAAKGETAKIFNKVAQVFQAVGAVLMVAIGSALLATGAGTAVGIALVAAGVMTGLALANSIYQEANGAGFLGQLAKEIDPNADPNVVMALDIGFTAVMIAGAIAATVFSGGTAAAAALGPAIKAITAATAGVTQIGSGLATIGSSSYGIATAVTTNEAKTLQAESKEIEAFMQQLDDLIDQALQMMMQSSERFNAIVDSVTDMMKENSDTMSATRFAV